MTNAELRTCRTTNHEPASDRFEVAVDGLTWSQCFPRYQQALPGLMLSDGQTEVIFTAGARRHEARAAKEFAINLAYNALAFARECNKRLTACTNDWPEDDADF
ncbi:hypothetical protein [Amycolatopsis sp. EV170708-02-1]|uniref:hypothetical protein n=1 Tax=Amycolatopsis sp. EV170708-02-1 TaxID=2919322 RepID=UPI001F0C4FB8|nr:hypothetical protein [Amycolatopsis sp. EV170708-02-1]UMP04212.1 hypothetical protein MJQ72_04970 [Amycolatopsis sp. EV170708-02-1]